MPFSLLLLLPPPRDSTSSPSVGYPLSLPVSHCQVSHPRHPCTTCRGHPCTTCRDPQKLILVGLRLQLISAALQELVAGSHPDPRHPCTTCRGHPCTTCRVPQVAQLSSPLVGYPLHLPVSHYQGSRPDPRHPCTTCRVPQVAQAQDVWCASRCSLVVRPR